ncbi:gp86 [Synechococcus phage syn9]|uniref:Gp86 n=1 Tax=Synechococcus phage syn9 TaxID=382359 RepID=Q0QZE2_BPSYS|nr:gp86 [Synechococcus phage syn9]ABA47055.1 gp86 [Synechococcus phage syn9]AGH56584.1 hypothetical protein CPUG_00092 [Cyanophage Syn10]
MKHYQTSFHDQFSYISITLRETVSILFHRLFHRQTNNLWKTRKVKKYVNKSG